MKTLVATRIEPPTFEALKEMARKQDRPVAYLVRKAVEELVRKKTSEENT